MSLLLDVIVFYCFLNRNCESFFYDREEIPFDKHITVFYLTILKIKHYLSPVVKANIDTDESCW